MGKSVEMKGPKLKVLAPKLSQVMIGLSLGFSVPNVIVHGKWPDGTQGTKFYPAENFL